jgi:hypothetical protein
MAEQIQVELVDDIDGSPAQHTVTFALDGVTYEIDLNERHAQQLRSVLTPYITRSRSPQRVSRAAKQQEREERETRQANRQLTEQIRGAAQRTRDKLTKKPQKQAPAEQEQPIEEPVLRLLEQAPEHPEHGDTWVPAVALPTFSSVT